MFKRLILISLILFMVIAVVAVSFAQEESEDGDNRQSVKVSERLAKEREKPPEIIVKEGFAIEKPQLRLPAERIMIEKIEVIGVTLLSEKEIGDIIRPHENKELSLKDMQEVAKLITGAYRRKGYITSGAYIPIQNFKQGILEIRVIEGATGEIKIEGNRYFKTSWLKKKITLKKGDPFNKNTLEKN